MKTVVLAEKPSVAREIARILNCNQKIPGGLQNQNYIVTWALGHLVTLAMPEEYDEKYKNWDSSMLPIIPEKFKTSVIKETSKQYHFVKELINDKNTSEVIIATDAGREGELVARLIIKQAKCTKTLKRLWISSMTDTAIKDGFKNLLPASKYDNLYYSALARAKSDWLVGLNVTRALSCKYNASLNAGRVQTPTIAMVLEKENEINKFIPTPYHLVYYVYPYKNKKISFLAEIPGDKTALSYLNLNLDEEQMTDFINEISPNFFELSDGTMISSPTEYAGGTRIFKESRLQDILQKTKNTNPIVTKVEKKEKKKQSPLLYDLTELQRDGNKIYGFSPKQTLDIIQNLYEKHKILTYPRTDSRYLTTDMYATIKDRIKAISYNNFSQITKKLLEKPLKNSKKIFDNSKVSDHHAIIPTEQYPNIMALSSNELKIYELVIKRFLAVFLDDYTYLETKVSLNINGYTFKAKGKTDLNLGWQELYKNIKSDDPDDYINDLPIFKEKDILKNGTIEVKKALTTPPARYTEATILSAMEHPSKFVTNRYDKEILEDTGGLGTPATRADILEKLFTNGYLELKSKSIYPTNKAKKLIDLVPEDLKSPLLTANYETRLKKIAEGKEKENIFLDDIIKQTKTMVSQVQNSILVYTPDNLTSKKCPECGNLLQEITTKTGKSLACISRTCNYRVSILLHTMTKCPNCYKKLDLVGTGESAVYQCSCGFKEKKMTFLKNRVQEKKKEMSKKEVNTYLKKQNDDIPKNNPFSDFFK